MSEPIPLALWERNALEAVEDGASREESWPGAALDLIAEVRRLQAENKALWDVRADAVNWIKAACRESGRRNPARPHDTVIPLLPPAWVLA